MCKSVHVIFVLSGMLCMFLKRFMAVRGGGAGG